MYFLWNDTKHKLPWEAMLLRTLMSLCKDSNWVQSACNSPFHLNRLWKSLKGRNLVKTWRLTPLHNSSHQSCRVITDSVAPGPVLHTLFAKIMISAELSGIWKQNNDEVHATSCWKPQPLELNSKHSIDFRSKTCTAGFTHVFVDDKTYTYGESDTCKLASVLPFNNT